MWVKATKLALNTNKAHATGGASIGSHLQYTQIESKSIN